MQYSSLLGRSLTKNAHYNIYGAGLSGLFTGYFLKQQGISFTIYESSNRAGGLIQTKKTPEGLAEGAANAFIWCDELDEICKTLGITPLAAEKKYKAKYFYKAGGLRRFPFKISDIAKLARKVLFSKPGEYTTLEEFGNDLAGKDITNNVINPAFKGIYGAGAGKLGFKAVFPKLAEAMKNEPTFLKAFLASKTKTKGAKKSPKGSHSFETGMGELTIALSRYLEKEIIYNTPITTLKEGENIVCLPAYSAAQLFSDPLNELLGRIDYTPVASVTFFTDIESSDFNKKGFGILVPDNAGLNTMGILLNPYIFEGRSFNTKLNFTCIVDISHLKILEEQDLIKTIKSEAETILGTPFTNLNNACFKYMKGIPLYSPDLPETLLKIDNLLQSEYPNTRIFGNYTGAISIRGLAKAAKEFSAVK